MMLRVAFSRLAAAAAIALLAGCVQQSVTGARAGSVAVEPVHTLSFDRYMNLIFLVVRANGSAPLSFNLDSGLEVSVLDAGVAERLRLPLRDRTPVEVPGGRLELAFADGVRLQVGDLTLPEQPIRTIPLSIFEPVLGRPIQGTLGHDLFARFVVDIDYDRETIRLYRPETYAYSGSGIIIPLLIEDEQAFINAEILQRGRPPVPAKLKLDTGSADALGLNGSFVRDTHLIPPEQARLAAPGVALGGITENYVARVEGLRLGSVVLPGPVTGFSQDLSRGGDAGTIGGEIFRRFRIIFDYSRRRLILEPNRHLGEPFEWDASGLFLMSPTHGRSELQVLRVTAGTPAAESGFRDGDVITSIDGRAPPPLEDVRRLFKDAGERHRVRVRRGEAEQELTLMLRRLL